MTLTRASSWSRKVKHLTRGRYVQVDSDPALTDRLAMEVCPSCGWRGLYARTFARARIYANVIYRWRVVRTFSVCGGCRGWREL